MIELGGRFGPVADLAALDAMIELWERILALSPIGADDDFFDLGGDSLQALAMFHEIERITGRTLPITAIYDATTPARLVALLTDGAAPAPFSPVVPLKAGFGAPLFIFHGIGGTVMELKKLAQLLSSPRPVYAIQAKGIDGTEEPFDRMEDMVAYYMTHVRARQPNGPYHLAGYSYGGLVAMELARRLQAEGEKVAFLGFFDSYAHPQTFPKWVRQTIRLHTVLDAFRTMPFRAACGSVMARLRGGVQLPPGMIDAIPEDGTTAPLRHVHEATMTALLRYRPTAYAGKVVFFRPDDSIYPVEPRQIWGKLIGDLTVRTVPGGHNSMVRQDVAGLAKALSRGLQEIAGVA